MWASSEMVVDLSIALNYIMIVQQVFEQRFNYACKLVGLWCLLLLKRFRDCIRSERTLYKSFLHYITLHCLACCSPQCGRGTFVSIASCQRHVLLWNCLVCCSPQCGRGTVVSIVSCRRYIMLWYCLVCCSPQFGRGTVVSIVSCWRHILLLWNQFMA